MTDNQEDSINAREDEAPRPKQKPGRKPIGYYERSVQEKLDGSAKEAAIIIDNHMMQRVGYKKIKDSVLKICFFVVEHAIGKARQKVELSGGVMAYGELAKSALKDKPRPVLSEALDIAHKYQEKTAEPGSVSEEDVKP